MFVDLVTASITPNKKSTNHHFQFGKDRSQMEEDMKMRSFLISKELDGELTIFAKSRGMSVSEVMRKLVEAAIQFNEEQGDS